MRPFAIAGIQMYVHFGEDNISVMEFKLDALMNRFPWVDMVVFSELCAFGASIKQAQPMPGPAEERFQSMASKHGVWLLPGSIFEKKDGEIYNTCPVINPQGKVVDRYRKMFPFLPYEQNVSSGTEFVVFEVPDIGKFGVSICYDMWFPETTRTLVSMGAEVILHPSLTDTIDRDVELAIARASAAVNQCFFIDVNGVGHGGNGRSTIVRPTGTVIYTAGSGEEFMPVDIDINNARRGRSTGLFGLGQVLKSFRDRKVEFEVYDRSKGSTQEFLNNLGPLVRPERRENVDEASTE